MHTVNIHEAKTHLSRLVDRAAKGESFIIAKSGKPMVKVVPVDAPEGTAARPNDPPSVTTSTSTVGLPRLSRICRAWILSMRLIVLSGFRVWINTVKKASQVSLPPSAL